ncbi:MAG: hypothetical protein GX493_11805 [Firmicutes bacterium]|nr:hypothetical protein [Bacillota bacterium]
MEKRGRDFYLALADLTGDPEACRVLETLAAEEEEHAAVFARGLPGGVGELSKETRDYLEALLIAFAPRAPGGIDQPAQGLALAGEMEKDSIFFTANS